MDLDRSQAQKSAVRRIYYGFFAAVCLLLLLLLPGVWPLGPPEGPQAEGPQAEETLLLVWLHPFGFRGLPDCRRHYGISGCRVTDDRSAYREANAVLFHHRDVSSLPREPRPPAQKWVWMNFESPSHVWGLQNYEGVYNLTVSYREDSDVPVPYGYLIPNALLDLFPKGRTVQALGGTSSTDPLRPHLVAWVVSNWSESQARVAFYKILKEHVQVDVFGKAGRPVPQGQSIRDLVQGYHFYLALENSQHTDYITEKLWNAVCGGAIPVVLGPSRQNYEHFLPADAFIHVDDFPTVPELARYLLAVWRSPALTQRHLRWRKSYSVIVSSVWFDSYCTACWQVRKNRGTTQVVRNLKQWFLS